MHKAISLLALQICILAATGSAQQPSTEGFITIDCGFNGSSSYKDSVQGIVYSRDEPYTTTGENRVVSPETNLTSVQEFYRTVRSFPEGVRNCYTLAPVKVGSKYRITGEFFYGNYDGLRRSPVFDLYLGVNLWTTVKTGEFARREIITVAAGESIQVCLVNTGRGTPFISELDLRPLPFSSYSLINDSFSAILFHIDRENYGGEKQIRFPDDPYDRGWHPRSAGISISTTRNITMLPGNEFPMPQAVLQTASVAKSLNDTIEITTPQFPDQQTYVYMYFTELQELAGNETREFRVHAGNQSFRPYRPTLRQEDLLYSLPPGKPGGISYFLRATTNSTLPPMINAVEIFSVINTPLLPTTESDVNAILGLKKLVNGSRNWEGDPCVPRDLIWNGLGCGYGELNYSRITSLDLSHNGLSGQVPPSIANLTNLTSLNLSDNNFNGEVPAFLGELAALKLLNLDGNNLSGTIPKTILDKSRNGTLTLSIDNNPLCHTSDICRATATKENKSAVPIVVGVIVAILLLLGIVITLFIVKRRRARNQQSGNRGTNTSQVESVEKALQFEGNQFSKADIIKITNDFMRPIGEGGFGTVYHGVLQDGREVAVKLVSTASVHGARQFRAEAELLTRVHHRYLVSLLGYCNENMALVYEYVSQGSLADHLSADPANRSILSWNDRLRIALEAAQGLDYLHNGCNPPIVHRDVKPSNFLLTDKFEVKIADFGLSRSYVDGRNSFASTFVAGTPGYLDPEYQQTFVLSKKSDLYSFGVVLLELLTAKPPISRGTNVTHISKEVAAKMERGNLAEIADPKMEGRYDINSMWRLIDIAQSCASPSSSERPTISDVVAQLKECLVAETSMEFSTGMSSGTFSMSRD